jgi:hypothetical protein
VGKVPPQLAKFQFKKGGTKAKAGGKKSKRGKAKKK